MFETTTLKGYIVWDYYYQRVHRLRLLLPKGTLFETTTFKGYIVWDYDYQRVHCLRLRLSKGTSFETTTTKGYIIWDYYSQRVHCLKLLLLSKGTGAKKMRNPCSYIITGSVFCKWQRNAAFQQSNIYMSVLVTLWLLSPYKASTLLARLQCTELHHHKAHFSYYYFLFFVLAVSLILLLNYMFLCWRK